MDKIVFRHCRDCQELCDKMLTDDPDLYTTIVAMDPEERADYLGFWVCSKCFDCGSCNLFCFMQEDEDNDDDY